MADLRQYRMVHAGPSVRIRSPLRRAITGLVAATSIGIAVGVAVGEPDLRARIVVVALAGGVAVWMWRVFITEVRADGDRLVVRNPWRTYNIARGDIRQIATGKVGRGVTAANGPFVEMLDGRRVLLYAASAPYSALGRADESQDMARLQGLLAWWKGNA
ncbi:MAG TPA: hypothetical protein VNB24_09735 [Acidimicrobiales bacterium]|nr:hypothetical protein [Acidimicrobiales bacterium]